MEKLRKIRLLFIDPHEEWLSFVESTLADSFDVETAQEFKALFEMQEGGPFDLIFIGLNVAQENMDALSYLAESFENRWHFIVLFPGFPDDQAARILFKAGARDLLSKPYDPDTLRNVVEEELKFVSRRCKASKVLYDTNDYQSQVRRLWEYVQVGISSS